MKKVHFNDDQLVEYEPVPVSLKNNSDVFWDPIPGWAAAIVSALLIATFVIWVISLVRMGKCGGRKSWLWYVTIFVPIFVPVVGQAWALIVGIMAIVILGRGGELAGMKCKK